MVREDFKIIPKFYTTNTLVYIIYGIDSVIGFAESFENYGYEEDKDGKHGKSKKTKRKPIAIEQECESFIKRYIKNNG